MGPAVPVLVNGITGAMGYATAAEVVGRDGLRLLPVAFSGRRAGQVVACEGVAVELQPYSVEALAALHAAHPGLVVVDYTHPGAVHSNAALYAAAGVPFVMGTTGGDRARLQAEVSAAGSYAVVAPQMGKQLVALQAAFEHLGERYPGAFAGYTLAVTEAHQAGKADTSGTAKALVASFQRLGVAFEVPDIVKVRSRDGQLAMGVPEEHLAGHAYHTYRLTSPDRLVSFEVQHNVCGRSIYAQGTVDAVLFIAARARERSPKTLYSMVDVLAAGML